MTIAPQLLEPMRYHAVSRAGVSKRKREMAALAFQDQLTLMLDALESSKWCGACGETPTTVPGGDDR